VVLRAVLGVGRGKNIPKRVRRGRKEDRSLVEDLEVVRGEGKKRVTIWSASVEGE
jgi:hypothetical protein